MTLIEFVTKDSGQREHFATGAVRDTQEGKSRYDLIPVGPLTRLADLYARGAAKYGVGNYELGMPMGRVFASLLGHAYLYLEGDREEDHLAAVAWNAFALMFYEGRIAAGALPETLDDLPQWEDRRRTA